MPKWAMGHQALNIIRQRVLRLPSISSVSTGEASWARVDLVVVARVEPAVAKAGLLAVVRRAQAAVAAEEVRVMLGVGRVAHRGKPLAAGVVMRLGSEHLRGALIYFDD
jgi:hypothetical protein